MPSAMASGLESYSMPTFFVLLALLLSVFICAQTASVNMAAYHSAPTEILSFIDVSDSSVQENESYDSDIMKISQMKDKMRLTRLYRDIQRSGDELREELDALLVARDSVKDGVVKLRVRARLTWKVRREVLQGMVRRSDMLRMRFLVAYFSLLTSTSMTQPAKLSVKIPASPPTPPMEVKPFARPKAPGRPNLHKALTDEILHHPPLRRSTTRPMGDLAMGHSENVGRVQKSGWLGVVDELQRSPMMKLRHASIESAMMKPTVSRGSLSPVEKKVTLPSW